MADRLRVKKEQACIQRRYCIPYDKHLQARALRDFSLGKHMYQEEIPVVYSLKFINHLTNLCHGDKDIDNEGVSWKAVYYPLPSTYRYLSPLFRPHPDPASGNSLLRYSPTHHKRLAEFRFAAGT